MCRSLASAAAALLLLLPVTSAAQSTPAPTDCWSAPSPATADSARRREALGKRTLLAERAAGALPQIDGRLDDAAWCAAQATTDFIQSGPSPGSIATLPTVARIIYDDAAVYVGLRLFDPHPDSLVAPYPRRDDEATADWAFVEIDSRFDRRSGYSFGVDPRGVQVDGAWFDDVNYDAAWNGVWEAAAQIDSLGWTAEFRIPYSQLPLAQSAPGAPLPWGINFYRFSPHRGEVSNWSPRLPSVNAIVSRFNDVHGLVVPPRRAPLEVVPYGAVSDAGDFKATAGADLRMRPTANTAVALSIHPDFGQVESDPSQVNLTTFETFLPEQRPMFVEGADVFQFPSTLDFSSRGTSFLQESPFYSRRIGRPPRGGVPSSALDSRLPTATTLLGALRASGRTGGGWSGGLFHAWTDAEHAVFTDTLGAAHTMRVEPRTHFTVMRAVRDLAGGRGAIGAMATYVGRIGMQDGLDAVLPSHALVAGSDGRWRFGGDRYEVTGFALASRVDGASSAIGALRLEPRHGYAPSDTGHTSLDGIAAQARFARIDGRFQWNLAGRVVSRGFETNDVGFQRNANWLLAVGSWKYQKYQPGHLIRKWSVSSRELGVGWTFAGDRRSAIANLTGAFEFRNYWGGSVSLDHEFGALDPEVLRGGPGFLLPARDNWTVSGHTDARRRWQLSLGVSGAREPSTGSREISITPDFTGFLSDRLQVGLSPTVGFVRSGWQYVAQSSDAAGAPHYILGELHQTTTALTARATYAFSPHLTLQLYSQLFLSGGRYQAFKEVVAPRAARAADRVALISDPRLDYDSGTGRYLVDGGTPAEFAFADPTFSDRELHANLLLRWEFLPGSTLFLAYTQQRLDQVVGAFGVGRDLRRLWHAPAQDALLLKVSYWIAR